MFEWAEVTGAFRVIFQLDMKWYQLTFMKRSARINYVVGINIEVVEQLQRNSAVPTL